ncbi:glycosyltransferase family 4 protein [Pistricoccus aurantiacus]|nr:glycosyltransferase family 4 protein [Pistricoccus aurantiacus]
MSNAALPTRPISPQVLHICLSEGWGGLEMYPARIAPELARQGWRVHGLAVAGSPVAQSFREAGIEPLTVSSRGRALLQVWRIWRYLREQDIRVVHCHKSSDLRLGALLKTLWPTLRLFFTDHMGVTRPKKGLYHRWAYGKLTRLFSISEATRQRNLKAFALPESRIHRLYLGIDPTHYDVCLDAIQQEKLREALGIPRDTVMIGLPGRITPGKGQRVFLEALAQLRDQAPQLVFHGLLIGGLKAEQGANEPFVTELESLITNLGLEERVSFTGFRTDLPRLLALLDIVCVPSRNEAFGLTVLEAMAAGKAIVGADSGAIPELLGDDHGRLANPQEPQAWASAMRELAQDTALRERLGKRARQRALRDFSLREHVRRLTACYVEATRPDGPGD